MPTLISMFRDNLNNIPDHPLPDKYMMRSYQAGDIQYWLDFHIPLFPEGHITEQLFWEDFGRDESVITQRQFYMQHDDVVMGSISAWDGRGNRDVSLGRIHWVVLREDYRGKGLAKPLLSFAMYKLAELGHTQAYLTTDTDLIPAINLYLQFGFQPEITTKKDQKVWDIVFKQLKK